LDEPQVNPADYQALAEFRHQIRRYVRFSEMAAKSAGLEPRQYQLLAALKGAPPGCDTTLSYLAERLQIRHHSAVGLVDRLAERRLVERMRNPNDRRQVLVRLTRLGETVLRALVVSHLTELRAAAPNLVSALQALTTGADSFWPPGSPARPARMHRTSRPA
jgi:DNA-binding MarR family transcriptional regulator